MYNICVYIYTYVAIATVCVQRGLRPPTPSGLEGERSPTSLRLGGHSACTVHLHVPSGMKSCIFHRIVIMCWVLLLLLGSRIRPNRIVAGLYRIYNLIYIYIFIFRERGRERGR